ncbi:Mov34/MPN/PAD-1 family protein [Candidatus Bathyarchaeota archaeon]|nr:Mov34/MPN/PAD-1 family protein [Candidatus Bathyarchaeota archaeon]MBS7628531.1 Mov34/MPN/PAD-1 family protein [Candidatus Bathyarchaeota archaeon]
MVKTYVSGSRGASVKRRRGGKARRKDEGRIRKALNEMSMMDRLESLCFEVKTLRSSMSAMQSDTERVARSVESQIADLREYFRGKTRDLYDSVEELQSKVDEIKVSIERLSRDLDLIFKERIPMRRIRMPPPISSQLTIYRGEGPAPFQIGVAPGVTEAVMANAKAHTNRAGKPDEEVVGLLVGRVVGNTVVVEEAIACRASYSDVTEVAMDPKNLAEIVDKIMREGGGRSIVGWYHSHPGLGAFLSDVDVKTQLTLQQFSHVIALVVDPLKEEFGFFYVDMEAEPPEGRPKIMRFLKF